MGGVGKQFSWRRFGVLLEGLPGDSAFARAVAASGEQEESGGKVDPTDWPLRDQLLAMISDLLLIANFQRSGAKGQKPDLLILGKGAARRPDQVLDQDAVRAALQALDPGLPE